MKHVWSSRRAFIFAATGSAVGLGNVWRFPYITGEYGGGAFVLVYLACVLILGMPLLIAEVSLGRIGGQNPVSTMKTLSSELRARKLWQVIGWLSVGTPLLAFMFYAVVAGWTMDYSFRYATGSASGTDAQMSRQAFDQFLENPGRMMLSYSLFALVTVSIVANGLRSGLERAVKLLIPLLFGLLILLAIYTAINADIIAGAKFLFRPDFSKITGSVVLIALGQAFFSLSIGIGASLAFGAYIPNEMSIPSAIAVVVAADTLIAVLAGLVLFPLVLNYGLMPGEGPSLVFITLPIAFAQMSGGNLFGALFFLLLALAALTTSIAMMEPCVSWLTQTTKMRRSTVSVLVGLGIWAGGIPALLSFNLLSEFNPLAFLGVFKEMTFFDVMELTTTTVLLPTCGMLIALFVGWVLPSNVVRRNGDREPSMYFKIWRFLVRYIAPIGIMSLFLSQLASTWA